MINAKTNHNNIANAIRTVRNAKGLSQEDFSLVSSRTYMSTLERGLKSPTLSKLDDLAAAMEIHPLTLLTLAYMDNFDCGTYEKLMQKISAELDQIRSPS